MARWLSADCQWVCWLWWTSSSPSFFQLCRWDVVSQTGYWHKYFFCILISRNLEGQGSFAQISGYILGTWELQFFGLGYSSALTFSPVNFLETESFIISACFVFVSGLTFVSRVNPSAILARRLSSCSVVWWGFLLSCFYIVLIVMITLFILIKD